jgi:hypothetical protein
MELKELMELYRKAAPGEWGKTGYTNYQGYAIHAPKFGCVAERWENDQYNGAEEKRPQIHANGELIVELHNSFPAIYERLMVAERMAGLMAEKISLSDKDIKFVLELYRAQALTQLREEGIEID